MRTTASRTVGRMHDDRSADRRIRAYWAEEDIWFYLELDIDGYIIRHVELKGSALEPIAAASLPEWQAANTTSKSSGYEAIYGWPGEGSIHDWQGEGFAPQDLTAAEFESVWASARTACEAGARAANSSAMR